MDELLFTSASILDLLSNIDELKDKNIRLNETASGIEITIGDSTYSINADDATDIQVENNVVEEINDITAEAYDDLSSDGVYLDTEDVEGGLIKELVKTLMIGGMVRMTSNMLKK